MVNVKATAAVLVTSMSLFSAVPASAATTSAPHPLSRRTPGGGNGGNGSTPIGGSSSTGGSTTGNGSGVPTNGGSNNGGATTGSSSGSSSSSTSGSGTSIGGNPGSTPGGVSGSPITSGNRPNTSGNNTPRPGPRSPEPQPDAGGIGPFGDRGTNTPRGTMDGTEGSGFNFGNILSGINSLTSTIFQVVATFAMLKQIFGWFGDKKEKASDGVKEVAAVADRGANVARDAATKIDEKTERERRRAAGEGDGTGVVDADGSGAGGEEGVLGRD